LAALVALLEAIRRLNILAERLRVRAESRPTLSATESENARRQATIARESVTSHSSASCYGLLVECDKRLGIGGARSNSTPFVDCV